MPRDSYNIIGQSHYPGFQPSWRWNTIIVGEGNNFTISGIQANITCCCRTVRICRSEIAYCMASYLGSLCILLNLASCLVTDCVINDDHLVFYRSEVLSKQRRALEGRNDN